MLKNAHFLEKKTVKIASSSGALLPNSCWSPAAGALPPKPHVVTPACYYNFCCPFLAINAFYYNKKEHNNCRKGSAFAPSEAFPPIFHFSLLTRGAKMFLAPGRRVP